MTMHILYAEWCYMLGRCFLRSTQSSCRTSRSVKVHSRILFRKSLSSREDRKLSFKWLCKTLKSHCCAVLACSKVASHNIYGALNNFDSLTCFAVLKSSPLPVPFKSNLEETAELSRVSEENKPKVSVGGCLLNILHGIVKVTVPVWCLVYDNELEIGEIFWTHGMRVNEWVVVSCCVGGQSYGHLTCSLEVYCYTI